MGKKDKEPLPEEIEILEKKKRVGDWGAPPFELRYPSAATEELMRRIGGGGAGDRPLGEMPGGVPRVPEE